MKKKVLLASVFLVILVVFTGCAPDESRSNEDIAIFNKGNVIGVFPLNCAEPFFLINGQQASFNRKYQLRLVSGEIVVRHYFNGGGQIDTYAVGESTVELTEKGKVCRLKVIVKPSPYSNTNPEE